jgi:Xaa-Pro aminopeptidase
MNEPVAEGYVCLSLAEKARRHKAVRERMCARGVSALVIQANSTKWDCGIADVRYLSHIGGNGEEGYLIFDLKEDPAYVMPGAGHIENWLAMQNWTRDLRPSVPSAARAISTRIKELGLERQTVGLVGRARGPLVPDGRWPYAGFEAMRSELPEADFVDFDDDLAAVRALKSEEEIACHERAMVLTERAIEVMVATARVGTKGCEVFGRMVGAMVAGGADMSVMVQLNIATEPRLASRLVTDQPLQEGQVILNEVTAKYAGYWSQAHAPVSIGGPPGRAHQRLFDAVRDGLEQGQAALKPGITVRELADIIRGPADDAGCGWSPIPTVKGIGLATSEHPISPPPGGVKSPYGSGDGSDVIAERMVLCFQPSAWDAEARLGMHAAETYVVTANGCRRLGRRAVEFHTT